MLASGASPQAVDGAVNALSTAQGAIQGSAGTALGAGFHTVYLVAAVAAAASAVLTVFISGKRTEYSVEEAQVEAAAEIAA